MSTHYDKIEMLTPKESEILQLLIDCNGDYDAIATRLVISMLTVKSHMNRIFSKLRVKNKTAAVIEGLKCNLISLTTY